MTFYLIGDAHDLLFPPSNPRSLQDPTHPLDEVVRRLSFIGASNFWWSMCDAMDVNGALDWTAFAQRLRESRMMSQGAFKDMHRKPDGTLPKEMPIYNNSIFTTRWADHVLRVVFGLKLKEDAEGQLMTFKPFNGPGNRFSWTLGKAVLLASPDLEVVKP